MFSSLLSYSKPAPTSPQRKISPPVIHGNHIDKHDGGLRGAHGAEAIVKLLRAHRSVKHLMLGHNELGDAGCVALFDYLRSEDGRHHQIVEISLNANRIEDAGLWAIARYLEGHESLRALFIQNNSFQGDRPVMLRFALAVNRSNLHTLSLTCNTSLGDAISTTFLANLSAPRLSELHLSVCSLGPPAVPALVSYLASPRALGLHTLKLNGNALGLQSVARIVRTLERANWSIGWVEMHACCLASELDSCDGWKKWEEQLRVKVLERNRFLRRKAEEDAIVLLPHARAALLVSERSAEGAQSRLPPELVIYILSFLAPSLSPAQHLRVCKYASSPHTLPPLGLIFNPPSRYPLSPSPQPWPASLSRFSPRHTCVADSGGGPIPPVDVATCPACARMKRIMSPLRDEERKAWLKTVGCDRFESGVDQALEEEEEDVKDS